MKTLKFKLLAILVLGFTVTSCLDERINELENTNTAAFEFKTIKDVNVSITTLTNDDKPLGGVLIAIYTQNPLDETGALKANSAEYLMFKGITDASGLLESKLAPATTVDSLMILVNQIGLPNYHAMKLESNNVQLVIGGKGANNVRSKVSASTYVTIPATAWTTNKDFLVLGSWSGAGVPNYLTTKDIIASDFLSDVNASLPERIGLPESHPEYFDTQDDGNLVLEKDAEVWVTFVHEGAGYQNSLAYYTHPNGNAPASATDINDKTVIFPNVSFLNSGGGLSSGNKVQLFYYNQTTKLYTNIFPAGTTVCWIIRSNAWSNNTVGAGYNSFYSDARFNPEKTEATRKHNVVLKDVARQLFLLGFEDLHRDNESDNDFNDAVFYATVSPYTAVKSTIYKSIDSVKDRDNDGVPDAGDDYPDDAAKAFNNYYPAINQNGTLAFEDLWPGKGDYDFNDVVVDYNFNQITNAQNKTTAIDAKLTLRASGANNSNGFAIEFNTNPDNVLSVTGQNLTDNIINQNTNGTEKGQANAVIFAFDNAFSLLKRNQGSANVNTVSTETYVSPAVLNLKITFKTPLSFSEIGTAPFNPFIIIGGDRGREVHLPGSAPTTLADATLFGTANDDSNLNTGKYYMSDKYLPWAINIPIQFDYPAEKQDITQAYLNFNKWVASRGFNNMDWYKSNNGYRDNDKIYSK